MRFPNGPGGILTHQVHLARRLIRKRMESLLLCSEHASVENHEQLSGDILYHSPCGFLLSANNRERKTESPVVFRLPKVGAGVGEGRGAAFSTVSGQLREKKNFNGKQKPCKFKHMSMSNFFTLAIKPFIHALELSNLKRSHI